VAGPAEPTRGNGAGPPQPDGGSGAGRPGPGRVGLWPPLAASVASAIVWTIASEIPIAARIWTTFLIGVLPVLLILQARATGEAAQVPRRALYGSSAIALWILAGATALSARFSRFDPHSLGFASLPWTEMLLWTVAITAAGVLVLFLAHAAGIREAEFVAYLMPRTREEKTFFAALSLTAGFCEELVFRGFLIPVIDAATGSVAIAAVVSSAVFGVLHAYQRPAGAVRAAALGLLLAIPFLLTGSILPAMAAHAAIDLISGLVLRDRLLS
jgi:membrane protease YdiL (CAAX protease family)